MRINEMYTAFFIQARTGSTRLPGKVLLPFFKDQSILEIIINSLKTYFNIPIVVCTSVIGADDAIERFCKRNNVPCYRGSENNVLQRFTEAANYFKTENIIRVCADNPFLDVSFLNELIRFHLASVDADYWSFKNNEGTPVIKTHFGFFAEIVTAKALLEVEKQTSDDLYLEHVTNYIYSHQGFNCKLKNLPDYLVDRKDLRFTIDDEEDFRILKEVYQYHETNGLDIKKTISYVENNKVILDNMIANINRYSK